MLLEADAQFHCVGIGFAGAITFNGQIHQTQIDVDASKVLWSVPRFLT